MSARNAGRIVAGFVLLLALFCFTLTSGHPWLALRPTPNADQAQAGREAVERIAAARDAGRPVPLVLTAAHLDGASSLFSQLVTPARVDARIESGRLVLAASRPLPLGRWFNIVAVASADSRAFPETRLRVGWWRLSPRLSRLILDAGWRALRLRAPELPLLDNIVHGMTVEMASVSALVSLPRSKRLLGDLVGAGADPIDARTVVRLYCGLVQAQQRDPQTEFAEQVRRVFAMADGSAGQNRAAFVALAMFAVGDQVGDLAGSARDDSRACQIDPPTLYLGQSRTDLPKHWALSAALVAAGGTDLATAMGEWKELADSLPHGEGFSFVDLAADRAGFRAARAGADAARARRLAGWMRTVTAERLLPPALLAEPERLNRRQFEAGYRSIDSMTFDQAIAEIDRTLDRAQDF